MDKMDIYSQLPIFAQNAACFAEGMKIMHRRYGTYFQKKLAEYESHNAWSYEQMCEYRDRKLQRIIKHCYNTVPHYKKMFCKYGISPTEIKRMEDLRKLPILTKKEVKQNVTDFISRAVCNTRIKIHPTGGTTGAGLRFRTSEQEEAEQWAVWWRYRRLHGINRETLCANFGGKRTVPIKQDKAPFWRYDLPGRQIFYSGYHITTDTVEQYADSLKKNNIHWIHGYPSNIALLAAYLNEKGIQIPMKWVSIGSENLLVSQKQQIEEVFCCKPIQHYGLTEGVANISEFPDGRLVVDEDFACVELIPDKENDFCHIIGSTLTNYIMPLIRYDTGDLAAADEQLGNRGRIVRMLQGRESDYIETPDGRKVGAAALSLVLCKFEEIIAAQIVQESREQIQVNIIAAEPERFRKERLLNEFRKIYGGGVILSMVMELEKTESGKQKLIIAKR